MKSGFTAEYWDKTLRGIASFVEGREITSVSQLAKDTGDAKQDPFRVLFSTMISLRTKDEVTMEAARRLFAAAPDLYSLAALSEERIAELIYPAGFYRTKGRNIKAAAVIIRDRWNGVVPRKEEDLLSLPGVGRKTANLTLSVGYGIDAICVDTHVHRISNRMGWVETRSPEETEAALIKVLPREYWIPINETLVLFGQTCCTPISPWCGTCPVPSSCARRGVVRARGVGSPTPPR